MSPSHGRPRHEPLGLRLSLGLIRLACWLAPHGQRRRLRVRWEAELLHAWQQMEMGDQPTTRDALVWSLGAFSHAWYLVRTEYTMDSIWQDFRYGLRSLNRNRGIISIAVLSLAIGIGANTAMFSMVDVFMLRPLPYPEAERLYTIYVRNDERGFQRTAFTVPDFLDLKDQSRTLTLAAARDGVFNLSGDLEAERLQGTHVTPEFFQVLGVGPARGRAFAAGKGRSGSENVVIISHELWQRRFGARPELVGSSIILDGTPRTVVGIMPPQFWFRSPGRDVWAPLGLSGDESRDAYNLTVLGRLTDGTTRQQAVAEARGIVDRIAADYPETSAGHQPRFMTLHEDVYDESFQTGSAISMAGVFLVLLIACANVANLLLTQAAGRDREVALRGALGAGRSRLFRQFLTEALIIAAVGGLLGVGLSIFGIRGLVAVMPSEVPRLHEIGLNGRGLLFTAGLTMLTGLLFGTAPAWKSSRSGLAGAMKEGGRGTTGSRGGLMRKGLAVAEVAMALVLLISSALLVQGLRGLRIGDMGFDRSDVLTMHVLVPEVRYPDPASVNDFWTELAAGLRGLPGVEEVGAVTILPAQGNTNTYYVVGDEDYEDPRARKITNHRYVFPGYFEALDVPVLKGRSVLESDRLGTSLVAVVNESLARRHWPGGNAIGQRINTGNYTREIVGVVADIRDPGLRESDDYMVYFSALQRERRFMGWTIEASVPLTTLVEPAKAKVRELDSTVPVTDVMPMDALVGRALGAYLIMVKIMTAVAIIALILALGGVYGVVGYSVSRRTQEMGVRMSLGARRVEVMGMVIGQGARLTLTGIAVGVFLALGVTRGLSFFLFGVSPFDFGTFCAGALLLLGAGVAATVVPARRATRVNPVEALRGE